VANNEKKQNLNQMTTQHNVYSSYYGF